MNNHRYLIRWLLGMTAGTALALAGWQLTAVATSLTRLDSKLEQTRIELLGNITEIQSELRAAAEQRTQGYQRLSAAETDVRELRRRMDRSPW